MINFTKSQKKSLKQHKTLNADLAAQVAGGGGIGGVVGDFWAGGTQNGGIGGVVGDFKDGGIQHGGIGGVVGD